MVVADDLGYDDLGHESVMGNSGKSISPNINKLMDDGIILHDYCPPPLLGWRRLLCRARRSEPCLRCCPQTPSRSAARRGPRC